MDRDEARKNIERSEEALALRVEALAGRVGRSAKHVRNNVQSVRAHLNLRDQSRRHPMALLAASTVVGWCLYRVAFDRHRPRSHERTALSHHAAASTQPTVAQTALRSAVSALVAALVSGLVRMGFAVVTSATFGSSTERRRLPANGWHSTSRAGQEL